MHILCLTRVNSLPLKSREKKREKKIEIIPIVKSIFIFDFTYDAQFLFDLDNE